MSGFVSSSRLRHPWALCNHQMMGVLLKMFASIVPYI